MEGENPRKRSGFVKVKCPDCGNEQPVFTKANTVVLCSVCTATLATPTGGKAIVRGTVAGELE